MTSVFELAQKLRCSYCGAAPSALCSTKSGRQTSQHSARAQSIRELLQHEREIGHAQGRIVAYTGLRNWLDGAGLEHAARSAAALETTKVEISRRLELARDAYRQEVRRGR